jgi:hypothetical protein
MSLIASTPHAKALGDGPKKRPASHWTLPGNHPEAEAENEPSVPSVTIVFDQLLILHELLIMLATDALNSLMRCGVPGCFQVAARKGSLMPIGAR